MHAPFMWNMRPKIISGEWPIEKFDEFVEKWYANGGEEVTERARAWHDELNS